MKQGVHRGRLRREGDLLWSPCNGEADLHNSPQFRDLRVLKELWTR